MRRIVWMLGAAAGLIAAPAMAFDDDSLALKPWARWQGRLSLGSPTPSAVANADATRQPMASLMGDYYFGRSLVGIDNAGGFRATSGLIFGPHATLSTGQPSWSAGNSFSIGSRLFGRTVMPATSDAVLESATLPYLGVGYTNLSVRSGWSFNADLGLVAQTPGGIRTVRSQSLDDAIREMRLAPLVQLGVSYAF